MTLLLTVLVFLFIFIIVLAIGSIIFSRRYKVSDRLLDIQKMASESSTEELLRLPFVQRIVVPFLSNMGSILGKVAPAEMRRDMEKKILYAGSPWNINVAGLLAAQVFLGGGFLAFSIFLLQFMQVDGGRQFFFALLFFIFGFFLPIGVISNLGEARKKAIQRALPDTLDLIQVSVEAGLGFDMALKKVTQQMKGPLSEEIKRALDEIRIGGMREDALRGIARRSGVSDLNSFISAVVQAEELGSNIANTLNAQADFMRQKRRQRAEEMAMKAPVKLVFPLLFFIFPALFVVVLGPAAINIFRVLTNL